MSRRIVCILISLLMIAALFGGCQKKEDEPVSESKIGTEILPNSNSSKGNIASKLASQEVRISLLERVYEARSGIKLTSHFKFNDTVNNSTSFQLEHKDSDDTVMIRVDLTEYQQVDFTKLAESESLFVENIVPKNVARSSSLYKVEKQVLYMQYKTGSASSPTYNVSAIVNNGSEMFKVLTTSKVDYYTGVLWTLEKSPPAQTSKYELVVDEIAKIEVGDVAFNAPMVTRDAVLTDEGEKKIRVEDGDEYIEAFWYKDAEESDMPSVDDVLESLGEGWVAHEALEGVDYLFTKDGAPSYRLVGVAYNDDIYIITASGENMITFLNTTRLAHDDEIYTMKTRLTFEEDETQTGSAISDTTTFEDFIATLSGKVVIDQKNNSWEAKITVDNYCKVTPSKTPMTLATTKAANSTITKSKVEGDHFIATAGDGAVYYFKQINLDGVLWNIEAIGLDGIAIAKSVKLNSSFVSFKDRQWQRMTFDKATFYAPVGTVESGDVSSKKFVLPNGETLVFEKQQKKPKDEDMERFTKLEEALWAGGRDKYIWNVRIGNGDYLVTCNGPQSREVLFSAQIAK